MNNTGNIGGQDPQHPQVISLGTLSTPAPAPPAQPVATPNQTAIVPASRPAPAPAIQPAPAPIQPVAPSQEGRSRATERVERLAAEQNQPPVAPPAPSEKKKEQVDPKAWTMPIVAGGIMLLLLVVAIDFFLKNRSLSGASADASPAQVELLKLQKENQELRLAKQAGGGTLAERLEAATGGKSSSKTNASAAEVEETDEEPKASNPQVAEKPRVVSDYTRKIGGAVIRRIDTKPIDRGDGVKWIRFWHEKDPNSKVCIIEDASRTGPQIMEQLSFSGFKPNLPEGELAIYAQVVVNTPDGEQLKNVWHWRLR